MGGQLWRAQAIAATGRGTCIRLRRRQPLNEQTPPVLCLPPSHLECHLMLWDGLKPPPTPPPPTQPPPLIAYPSRARHLECHEMLWDGLKSMGLSPFVEDPAERLITVNTIKVPAGVDWAAVVKNAMDK